MAALFRQSIWFTVMKHKDYVELNKSEILIEQPTEAFAGLLACRSKTSESSF